MEKQTCCSENTYTLVFVYLIVFVSEMPVVTEIYPDKPVFLKPVLIQLNGLRGEAVLRSFGYSSFRVIG